MYEASFMCIKKITLPTAAVLVALSKQPTRVGLCMTCGMFQACCSLPNRVSPEAEPMSAREELPPSISQEPRVQSAGSPGEGDGCTSQSRAPGRWRKRRRREQGTHHPLALVSVLHLPETSKKVRWWVREVCYCNRLGCTSTRLETTKLPAILQDPPLPVHPKRCSGTLYVHL